MTDFDRTSHDPATDADTTATPVPTAPVGAPPASGESGTFGAPSAGTFGTPQADTATSASAVPASVTTAPAPRQSRTRWFAAAALVTLVVVATALATLVLTGSSPAPTVVGYVPADSVAYGELRLDLPGDQRQKLGQFLSKFPGFADQAALDSKLDEVLDRLTSDSTDGKQTYTKDIKPWFDGELAFSIGAIPTMSATDPGATGKDARALLLMSIKDEALARAWFTDALAQIGVTGTAETYQGTQMTLFGDPATDGAQAAFALVGGKVAIAGDVTSVKAAIDTKGSGGLAKGEAFVAARNAAKGDHVGFMFMDLRALMQASMQMSETLSSAPPVGDALIALVPNWTAVRLRVEADALVMDGLVPHVAAAPGPKENRTNGLAAYAPPSTVALIAGNDVGTSLVEWLKIYRAEPSMAEAFKAVDQVAGMLGGLEAAVGWMGDSGIVVARDGDKVEGGFVSIPSDAAAGKRLLTTLRSFAQLGGAQAGITVRDEDYNGSTITILDLGSLRDLAGMAGGMGGLPATPEGLPDGRVEVAYVATDAVIAIGSSPDFIKHVLDAGAGASLADDARFQGLASRMDAQHNALNFIDINAIRELVEGGLLSATPAERAEYEESVKPFLTPFDALIGTGLVGDDIDQSHTLITIK